MSEMTRAERLELVKIVRQRAKLAKDDIGARQAQILADAEAALLGHFAERDARWRDITAEAREHMREIQEKLNARFEEAGIAAVFRPSMNMYWLDRGANAEKEWRLEMRTKIRTQAEASARRARVEIDRQSVALQEQLMAGSLESASAQQFLASLPSAVQLMPALKVPGLVALAGETASDDE